jgi:hypothetical protein
VRGFVQSRSRGLDRPVDVAAAPGEPGRLYVIGQAGVVSVLEDGKILDDPFLDIGDLTVTSLPSQSASEQGLLSIAFAPGWPVAVYEHGEACAAVIGGYVYRGKDVRAAKVRYFYGDLCSGTVWSLDPARPGRVRRELKLETTLVSFGEDAAGQLYLISRTGRIFRLSD